MKKGMRRFRVHPGKGSDADVFGREERKDLTLGKGSCRVSKKKENEVQRWFMRDIRQRRISWRG